MGSVFLLLTTLPVVCNTDNNAELDITNFISVLYLTFFLFA